MVPLPLFARVYN